LSASATFDAVACCIALAALDLSVLPHHESLADMDVEQWRRTQQVNIEGTFLTARTWLRHLREHSQVSKKAELKNVGLIIVGSESGHFGERGNADYASGKSAVQYGLMKSMIGDVARVWPGAR
jgi:NAD(P)-dependent dehydrogenase (short-subunit alcohol dehydrogenase family)